MSDTGTRDQTTIPPDTIPAKYGGWLKPWQPGKSGNPSGVSKDDSNYHAVRKICADNSVKAALKQVELMEDPDPRIVFLATEAVLKRGVGLPRDHSNEKSTRVDLSALNESERMSLAELLRKALGGC